MSLTLQKYCEDLSIACLKTGPLNPRQARPQNIAWFRLPWPHKPHSTSQLRHSLRKISHLITPGVSKIEIYWDHMQAKKLKFNPTKRRMLCVCVYIYIHIYRQIHTRIYSEGISSHNDHHLSMVTSGQRPRVAACWGIDFPFRDTAWHKHNTDTIWHNSFGMFWRGEPPFCRPILSALSRFKGCDGICHGDTTCLSLRVTRIRARMLSMYGHISPLKSCSTHIVAQTLQNIHTIGRYVDRWVGR